MVKQSSKTWPRNLKTRKCAACGEEILRSKDAYPQRGAKNKQERRTFCFTCWLSKKGKRGGKATAKKRVERGMAHYDEYIKTKRGSKKK